MNKIDYTGKVMRCSRGKIGLVTHKKELPWGTSWVGINLKDGSAWSSRHPSLVSWYELVDLSESKAE